MPGNGWFVAGVGVPALTVRSAPGLASDLWRPPVRESTGRTWVPYGVRSAVWDNR